MRIPAIALIVLALAGPAAASTGRVAFLHRGDVVVLDLATGQQRIALHDAGAGAVRFSGDGRLVSSGGRIADGPSLPTAALAWAPAGETAAYLTKSGAVGIWSRGRGRRTVFPAGWGATSLAWGAGGILALGRSVCHRPCGVPRHQEVWLWTAANVRRVAGPLRGVSRPLVAGVDPQGHALWWLDPQGSGSIAADGLDLYANGTRVTTTLPYPDYVVPCGRHLVLAAGGDRNSTHGKRILLDGRDVSRDRSHSWVSPACSPDGSTLVAAAGPSTQERRFGLEHRAVWQLLPSRRQLSHPPAGWTDEDPTVLADGSILFVRTRLTSKKANGTYYATDHGQLELLAGGRLSRAADVSFTTNELSPLGYETNYYGHYGWPSLVAVTTG